MSTVLATLLPATLATVAAQPADAPSDEVVRLRTATSKTFRNEDGSLTTRVFTGPVHFRGPGGSWKEIDTELVEADAPGYAYRNAAAAFRALFKEELGEDYMRFVVGGRSFDLTLDAAARGRSDKSRSGVAYRDAFPGVDVAYEVMPDGVKETLVLEDAAAPSRYRFYLETEDAGTLSATRLDNGAWEFRGERDDEPLFVLDPAFAIDAADEAFELPEPAQAPEPAPTPTPLPSPSPAPSPSASERETPLPSELPSGEPSGTPQAPSPETPAPATESPAAETAAPAKADRAPARRIRVEDGTSPEDPHAQMKVTRVGGRFAIDVAVDAQWLHDRDRVFPVLLDPSITVKPSLEDANFNASCPTCTPTLRDRNYIGTSDSSAWRTALTFDLGDIPASAAQVSNAQLKLYYGHCIPVNNGTCRDYSHQLDVHRMTSAWTTSSTTQSLAFEATPLSSYTLAASADHTWMNWNVTTTLKNWLSGTQTNQGLLVKRSSESPLGRSGPRPPGRRFTEEPSLRPALEVTWTADAVTLAEPDTLHSNGAELRWTEYAGASTFTSYEVHRSPTARFTPSAATLLTTVGTKSTTFYRDTTAAPSKAFTYKIVTNGNVSNERTVSLPADGQAVKVLQPGSAKTKSTYVTHDTGYTVCDNNGARDKLYIGSESTYVRRPILEFDLGDIPASATVTNATMSLWHGSTIYFAPTVNAHRVTAAWQEGTGTGSCTRNGATWYNASGTVPWAAQGGDYNSTVAASVTHVSGDIAGWDNFNLTGMVGDWLSGRAPNHGVLLKLSDETLAAGRAFSYWSDDFSVAPTLHPKLVLQYSEPVHAQAPSVKVGSPGDGASVSGTVTLSAAASDDRRVDKVEFLVDGSLVATDTSAPFEHAWASTSVANGSRAITARATDDAGNVTTSSAVTVTVGNSNAPTVSVTAPTAGANLTGTTTLTANASDDVSVSKVEFYVDGLRVGDADTASPYSVSWNTLDPAQPFYDGTHEVTAKAWDGHGNTTTSAAVSVNVVNGAGSKFKATIAATSAVPQAMTYDPALTTQDTHSITVSITNTSGVTWDPADIVWRYRWHSATGPGYYDQFTFGTSFPSGTTRTRTIAVKPPTLPAGVDKAEHTLRFDLYSLTSAAWFADKGNKPSDHPVLVNKAIEATALGLERYYQYEGEAVGAGMSHLTNVSSGNALLRWSPFFSPGRGLSTTVDLTYNSFEDESDSPVGNNFSLGLSSLTRFGLPLDVHPNNADTLSGRTNKYIEFTDSDGTTHRFTGNANGGWDEPPGVHLYLREYSTTDPQRKWALTRPDRVTFFYDTDGFPTSVEDANGNRIEYTWENTPSGEDPGGVKRRITTITDAAGLGATPAPNRKFTIDYYSKAEAKKAQVRGKIEKILDHNGSALLFDYYEDGNLLRLTQKGGANADGSFLADRSFVFTYTTPDGSAAAIPTAANRLDPAPNTNQSSRIYSVRDPRGNETTFTYYGPTSSQLRWKLQSRTNREGDTTSFSYDLANRLTTVTAPLSRVTKFAYDTQGKVTGITNPKNETTSIAWTADRHVWKVTEPTGKYTEFSYNDNGYLTDVWDQLRNRTTLEYQNVAVDANDVSTKWKTGRTIAHISQLAKKTDPRGTATATPTDDYQYTFEYDAKGNLWKVVEPEGTPGFATTFTYNADGTLLTATNARSKTTTFSGYDANGLATTITDAKNQVTKLGFDDDGLLRWVQDPGHASFSGGDPRRYRTYFDYDSFHRLGRQSTPKLTSASEAQPLIWSAAKYDLNDNILAERAPEDGLQFVAGPETTMTYDLMDRVESSTNPEGHRTEIVYDAGGRATKVTSPKGLLTPTVANDHAMLFDYDELDRVKREIRYDTMPATPKASTTHYCFDLAGDLVRVTAPNADLAAVDCAAPPPTHTTELDYDDAHRLLMVEDPLNRQTKRSYDANGNVETTTDALNEITTMTYDERNLLTKVVQPFDGTRSITTRYEYNEVGSLAKVISPRAHDKGVDSLATKYVYDAVDQLTRIDLPYQGSETPAYVYRRYDANGNLDRTTVPVETNPNSYSTEADLWNAIPQNMTTTVTHFDTGLPRTIDDHVNAVASYDYNARGQQTSREVAGKKEFWSYYDDGMLREHRDKTDSIVEFEYDENNRLKVGKDGSGITKASEKPIRIEVSYDKLDRVAKVRHRKENDPSEPYDFTSYVYDLNGNVVERKENGRESADGTTILVPPKLHTFTYDEADWLQTQHDYLAAGCQKVQNDFNAAGLESVRRIFKATQACDATPSFTAKQSTVWDYFKNGELKTLRTVNGNVDTTSAHNPTGSAAVIEKHDVSYVDATGAYVNGHRTKDEFFRTRPANSGTACGTLALLCTATYKYDGRDRLVEEDRGHGFDDTTTYQLNAAGSVLKETKGGIDTTYQYTGLQLTSATAGANTADPITTKYFYDGLGNLQCITVASQSACPSAGGGGLLKDYEWDDLNRLESVQTWTGAPTANAQKGDTTYTYDALDRVVKETESHSMNNSATRKDRTTIFTFLGLTGLVTIEDMTGGLSDKKTYTYDAYDHRISMVDDPAGTSVGPKTYTYGYDVHGSVSTLLDDATGTVKSTYGYDAYGGTDTTLTAGEDAAAAREIDPLNAYRYTGHRMDTGSGSLDMGARRFGPDSQSFLQPDQYGGALANLGLSMDPLSGNRYSLAAGNPVSYVEVDGHMLNKAAGGRGTRIRGGSGSGQPDGPGRSATGDVPVQPDDSFGSRLREGVEDFGGLFKGFGEQVWESNEATVATGCFPMLMDLGKCWSTASGSVHRAVTDPIGLVGDTIAATTAGIREDWRSGNYTEAIGRVAAEVAAAFTGGAASKGARGAAAATKTTRAITQARFTPGRWLPHFEKHGAANCWWGNCLGHTNSVEYLRGAQSLTRGGPGIATFVRKSGDTLFYRSSTNEFAVLSHDNIIRTYFKPDDGLDYWLRETGGGCCLPLR